MHANKPLRSCLYLYKEPNIEPTVVIQFIEGEIEK